MAGHWLCQASLSRTLSGERKAPSHFTDVYTEAQNRAALTQSRTARNAQASPGCLVAA